MERRIPRESRLFDVETPRAEMGRGGAVPSTGSAGAYLVTQAMRGMLPGVGAVSASAFVSVALTMLGSAFVACLVPAQRAASVDPMVVLRQE